MPEPKRFLLSTLSLCSSARQGKRGVQLVMERCPRRVRVVAKSLSAYLVCARPSSIPSTVEKVEGKRERQREVGERKRLSRRVRDCKGIPPVPDAWPHSPFLQRARIPKAHLPGATELIFKSSKPKSDRKEKGASAAGGSFSPMVTISGPLMLGSGSTSTCLARGEQGWPLWRVWAPGVPLSHFKSFPWDTKPTPCGFVANICLPRIQLSQDHGK